MRHDIWLRRLLALGVSVGILAACSAGSTASTTTTTTTSGETQESPSTTAAVLDAPVDDEFAAAVLTAVDRSGPTDGGAVVLSVRAGEITRFATGAANAAGDPLDPTQPFRVGSISKTFVSAMVLQMVDEGVVDLDSPLSTYLPDTPIGADATVRQLLGHDSGIPNYTDQLAFMEAVVADPSGAVPLQDVLDSVADVPAGEVGVFSYSNTNYILLGQMIEELEQDSLNNVLARRITTPLGLDDTYFADAITPARSDIALGWSDGFSSGDIPVSYRSVATTAWAAGSLISSTEDLHTFLMALLQKDLVSLESLGQMTFTGVDGYGLGLFQAGLGEGKLGYGHSGGILGYSSTMAMDPISGDTIIVLTNNDRISADAIAAEVILNVWVDS